MSKFEEIKERLKLAFDEKQAELLAEIIFKSYENLVKVGDFSELKEIVKTLAEAQKRTEERLYQLVEKMEQLAEAQKKTEERLEAFERATAENFNKVWDAINKLTERVEQLAEAQRKTEERLEAFERATAENFNKVWDAINNLTERVDQLAEAQRKTEERLNRLTERVDQLAEAQRRAEEEIRLLTEQVKNLAIGLDRANKQIGGLANTIGYILENEAIKALPKLLKRDHKLNVKGKLKRSFVLDKFGSYVEVNIFGEAFKNRTKYTIVGEAKSQLSKNDVDDFIRKKLKRLEEVFPKIFPVLVTHMISEPDVEEYAKGKGVSIFYSYEF